MCLWGDCLNRYVDEEFVDISSSSEGGKRYSSHRQPSGKNKFTKLSKKNIIIISSVAAVVVIASAVAGFVVFGNIGASGSNAEVENKSFKFDDGTTVSGVSIAGKTLDEAKTLLEQHKSDFAPSVKIDIDVNGSVKNYTQNDFEYTYNIDELLSEIKTKEETEAASKSLFSNNPTSSKSYEVTATVTKESVQTVANELEKSTNKKAENATVKNFIPYAENRFEYSDGTDGSKLNTENLVEQITDVFASNKSQSKIIAEVENVKADITVDDLKKNIVKLATYETVSTNTANGTANMETALKACNGSIIQPGEAWSFNECTGDSNLESNGYKAAHVISEGKLIDGIGGGICQASSTIYNAAVRANLEITERYAHLWASYYVPTGLDATIDYPNLDLRLTNPTDYQMFLECKMYNGSTLTVTFWGYKSPSYDFIATENEMTDKTSSDYTVKAWRVYYKDGKEVDRESLGSSTYDDNNGYVFISATNDSGAKDIDYDVIDTSSSDDNKTNEHSSSSSAYENSSSKTNSSAESSKNESHSSSSSSSSQSSSSSSHSHESTKPESPTQAPQTEPESSSETEIENPDSDN